ncbi:MAG: sensor histidine kinase [Dorea sp.]|nr:sensor histidine kinase [Dorea sp.]MCI9452724.1 sensor histidine kinase [Dorea sp.]
MPAAYDDLLYSSIILPMIPLCFYPVRGYLKSRPSVLAGKIIIAILVMVFCVALAGNIHSLGRVTDFVLYPAGIYFLYLYNREVKLPFSKKLFAFITACLVGGFSKLYATMFDYTLHQEGNSLAFSYEALGVQFLFLAAADVILYLPLSRYMGWVMENFHEEAVWKKVWCFPALFLASTYFMYPRVYRNMYVGYVRQLYPFVLFFFTFFVVLIYFLFYAVARAFVEKQKTEIANQMLSVQGAQYQQLLRNVEENSRIRHDFRHQLIVISELVGQKEYGKLKEYVGKYIDDGQAEMKLYSYSAAQNALISYYESICQRRGIRTEFSVSLPKKLPVSDQDFCVMLGNLLENAMEGVRDMKEPYISLRIRQAASRMLAIRVENPYQGELRKEGGHYRSSKRDGLGQGLESVNMIAMKYEGIMEILTEDQVFTVKILLQVPGRDAETDS